LTPEFKEQPRAYATEMITVLLSAQKDDWHHLVTGDESWFLLSYSPCRMWTLMRDDVASKPRREIRTAKFIFMIMWNLLGFHVIVKLPDGVTMNANYFTENILGPREEKIFTDGRAAHERRLVVRMDNAPVHNCGMTTNFFADHNMVPLQHSPYSPDLAASGFYLFPTVKKAERY
jgi:hypothetical protein